METQPDIYTPTLFGNIHRFTKDAWRKLFFVSIWAYYPFDKPVACTFNESFDTFMRSFRGWYGSGVSMCGRRMRDNSIKVFRPLAKKTLGQIKDGLPLGGSVEIK